MKNEKIVSENFEENKKSNVQESKNTKKKSSAQKAVPILIVSIISLLVILMCLLIAYYQVYKSNKQNANILEGVYASSYYSMVDNVNNLAVDISKYQTLTTKESKINTMNDMQTDCNYILAGLSVLPIERDNAVNATKFFNQVNGVCEAYTAILNKNEDLTQEQELLFAKIGLVLGQIKSNLNAQNQGMYDNYFNFIDAGIFDKTGMNELSASMGDLSKDSIEYPAMIFDGPFSTALETKVVKGLGSEEISKEQAVDYLKNTVYSGRDVKVDYSNETTGTIQTWDFSVEIEGKRFNAQVSKLGGLLMSISGYAEAGDPIMGIENAQEMAKTFANNIGFENMEAVWHEQNDNIAYINLASMQDGVILYPDLVKVKVDLTSQEIIGFEAQNYALNHVNRDMEFLLTESEVEDVLGFDYNILKTSKALIRLDDGKEVCTYEFVLERIDGDYFYYINANTKQIEKVMKLVQIKDVQKLI